MMGYGTQERPGARARAAPAAPAGGDGADFAATLDYRIADDDDADDIVALVNEAHAVECADDDAAPAPPGVFRRAGTPRTTLEEARARARPLCFRAAAPLAARSLSPFALARARAPPFSVGRCARSSRSRARSGSCSRRRRPPRSSSRAFERAASSRRL